jgi:putative lipase involved disintegration of autophagic bodies
MAAGFYGRTFVVVFIELVLVIVTQCCVKITSVKPSPEEMVARSDYVLRGIVKEKIRPDPRTSYGVTFQVKCIYKGDSTSEQLKNEIITIAGAG